jgi:DNA-binding beta-propeller fold protein YncE
MRMKGPMLFCFLAACAHSADMSDAGDPTVTPAMPDAVPGLETGKPHLTVIASASDGLDGPSGLAFAPAHPDQLWVVNRNTDGVVILFDPGKKQQRAETRIDAFGHHFMAKPSGIAFGTNNHFATSQDSRDEWNTHPIPPDDFMGPTLWSADLDIFAEVNQVWPKPAGALEGSHLDMLHESPWGMGLAHDHDNAYWYFDGMNAEIVLCDFEQDHGPGGSNHSDGRVLRYTGTEVHRVDGVPSQIALDPDEKALYVADTGADRVMRLDSSGGTAANVSAPKQMESLSEYKQMLGADWRVHVSVPAPTGLVLSKTRMYVFSSATGELVVYDREGVEMMRASLGTTTIANMTIGPDGKLYVSDRVANTIARVDP